MSRFDQPFKMKLGDITKTFVSETHAMDTTAQCAMEGAGPIWELLGLTEKEYWIQYPCRPFDASGNVIKDLSENVVDVSGNSTE